MMSNEAIAKKIIFKFILFEFKEDKRRIPELTGVSEDMRRRSLTMKSDKGK